MSHHYMFYQLSDVPPPPKRSPRQAKPSVSPKPKRSPHQARSPLPAKWSVFDAFTNTLKQSPGRVSRSVAKSPLRNLSLPSFRRKSPEQQMEEIDYDLEFGQPEDSFTDSEFDQKYAAF